MSRTVTKDFCLEQAYYNLREADTGSYIAPEKEVKAQLAFAWITLARELERSFIRVEE